MPESREELTELRAVLKRGIERLKEDLSFKVEARGAVKTMARLRTELQRVDIALGIAQPQEPQRMLLPKPADMPLPESELGAPWVIARKQGKLF